MEEKKMKQKVLTDVLSLNGEDKKYKISVDGNKIVTEVKWMDAVFFSPKEVTDEMKQFKFTVTLNDDNTYSEIDESKSVSKKVGAGGFGMQYSSFKGKEITFNKTIGIGKNKDTGDTGIVGTTFYSEEYKKPVRDFLKANGYTEKKKGFFKRLFGM